MESSIPAILSLSGQYPTNNSQRKNFDTKSLQSELATGTFEAPGEKVVYRGEFVAGPDNDHRYRPKYNQQIDPRNQNAIASYENGRSPTVQASALGQILDRFV